MLTAFSHDGKMFYLTTKSVETDHYMEVKFILKDNKGAVIQQSQDSMSDEAYISYFRHDYDTAKQDISQCTNYDIVDWMNNLGE